MSRLHTLRASMNTQLDKWEAGASALQAQLDLTRSQAQERLETQKKKFGETLDSFKENIERAKEIPSEMKARIGSQVDALQVAGYRLQAVEDRGQAKGCSAERCLTGFPATCHLPPATSSRTDPTKEPHQ